MNKKLTTPSGRPSAYARKTKSAVGGGRFPVGNKQQAMSALRLRGHATNPEQRARIIAAAAKYAPDAADKARARDRGGKVSAKHKLMAARIKARRKG